MSEQVHYFTITGELKPTTWKEVFASVTRIQRFFHEANLRFVERSDILGKLMCAFMLREHMLLDGPTGTGKSYLIDTIFQNIGDATLWAMDLSRFTVDTHLFGNYDVRIMREEGKMLHMTEGSIVEANFAKTGEFFDASDATLRTLLGVLNERKITRGPQTLKFPLITVVADTNFNHSNLTGRTDQLAAVVDRFLFHASVRYVSTPENRYALLELGLEGTKKAQPLPKLSLTDVELVSGVVRAMDLVSDRYVRQAYEQVTRVYSEMREKEGRPALSDRRYIKAAQILEVSALLHGRHTVTFEDLTLTRQVLCQVPEDEPLFQQALKVCMDEWVTKAENRALDAEIHRLGLITQQIPQVTDLDTMASSQVKRLMDELRKSHEAVVAFSPDSIEARTQRDKATTLIHETLAACDLRMIAILVESLPDTIEGVDGALLKGLMDRTRQAEFELRSLHPRSEEAIVRHAQALEQAGRVLAAIETEFMGKRGI